MIVQLKYITAVIQQLGTHYTKMAIIKCPITGKRYERFDYLKYHSQDCPYCLKIKEKKNAK
jgi:hypothetical protein